MRLNLLVINASVGQNLLLIKFLAIKLSGDPLVIKLLGDRAEL